VCPLAFGIAIFGRAALSTTFQWNVGFAAIATAVHNAVLVLVLVLVLDSGGGCDSDN